MIKDKESKEQALAEFEAKLLAVEPEIDKLQDTFESKDGGTGAKKNQDRKKLLMSSGKLDQNQVVKINEDGTTVLQNQKAVSKVNESVCCSIF